MRMTARAETESVLPTFVNVDCRSAMPRGEAVSVMRLSPGNSPKPHPRLLPSFPAHPTNTLEVQNVAILSCCTGSWRRSWDIQV